MSARDLFLWMIIFSIGLTVVVILQANLIRDAITAHDRAESIRFEKVMVGFAVTNPWANVDSLIAKRKIANETD